MARTVGDSGLVVRPAVVADVGRLLDMKTAVPSRDAAQTRPRRPDTGLGYRLGVAHTLSVGICIKHKSNNRRGLRTRLSAARLEGCRLLGVPVWPTEERANRRSVWLFVLGYNQQ